MMYIISEIMEADGVKTEAPVGLTFLRQEDAQAVLKMMVKNGTDGVSSAFSVREVPDLYEEGVSPSLDEIAEDILYQTGYEE